MAQVMPDTKPQRSPIFSGTCLPPCDISKEQTQKTDSYGQPTAAGMLIITTVQASATPRLLRYRSGIQYSPQIADEMTTAAEAKLMEGLRMVMTLFSKLSIDLSR